MKENFKLIKYKQRLCKLKKIKDQIGFIENYSYQLKFLYKKLGHLKHHKANCLLMCLAHQFFIKSLKNSHCIINI